MMTKSKFQYSYAIGLSLDILLAFRTFEAVARYCSRNSTSINFIIMLAFFTSTALQRLFTMHTMMPGTAKVITLFAMSIKPNLPEVKNKKNF